MTVLLKRIPLDNNLLQNNLPIILMCTCNPIKFLPWKYFSRKSNAKEHFHLIYERRALGHDLSGNWNLTFVKSTARVRNRLLTKLFGNTLGSPADSNGRKFKPISNLIDRVSHLGISINLFKPYRTESNINR